MFALDGSQVNLLVAFAGGVITFFASCLLPLVPTYLAYLAGIATSDTSNSTEKKLYKRTVFLNGLIFTIGFILVFVLLGATANTVGRVFASYKPLMQKVGGVFFIVMGLFMLELIKPIFLYKERKIELPKNLTKWKKLNSLLVGMTFGLAWTPCIGPVLAVILFWASQAQSLVQGVSLLFVYGIGLGLPFVVVAFMFESIAPKLSKSTKFGHILQKVAAIVILVMGILLLFGKVEFISVRLLQLFELNTLSV